MYSIGGKFEIQLLCHYALKHFRHAVKASFWKAEVLKDFKAAVREAYCSQGPAQFKIRDAIAESFILHIHSLMGNDALVKAIREEFPELSTDILLSLFGDKSKQWITSCPRLKQGHALCKFELK